MSHIIEGIMDKIGNSTIAMVGLATLMLMETFGKKKKKGKKDEPAIDIEEPEWSKDLSAKLDKFLALEKSGAKIKDKPGDKPRDKPKIKEKPDGKDKDDLKKEAEKEAKKKAKEKDKGGDE